MRRFSGMAHCATFLALFALLLSACSSTPTTPVSSAGDTTPTTGGVSTVALVTDTNDQAGGAFNTLANEGYTKARNQYGFANTIIQVSSQNDDEKDLSQAASEADLVVVAVGFDTAMGYAMEVALDHVARQNSNKKFAIVDGCPVSDTTTYACDTLPNVADLSFAEQEAGCLVGAIAGQMEVDGKSKIAKLQGKNTIGAVGGQAIPAVMHYIAGYKYCAEKVDPGVRFLLSYANNFTTPSACAYLAQNEIAQGADILLAVAGVCGDGVLDAASAANVFSIGTDVDQSKDAAGKVRPSVITSAEKRVDVAVYDVINEAESGQFASFAANSANYSFDVDNGGVDYTALPSSLPTDVGVTAQSYVSQIESDSITPPTTIP